MEYQGRVVPVYVGPQRHCSYMLLSTAFDPLCLLQPGSITVNSHRYMLPSCQGTLLTASSSQSTSRRACVLSHCCTPHQGSRHGHRQRHSKLMCLLVICRIPVERPVPDAMSGCFTIMSQHEYEQMRYHTPYDPLHIDGVAEYAPGQA